MIFEHKLVRDLAWVIGSPPLMGASAFEQAEAASHEWCLQQLLLHHDWLKALDQEPQPLYDFGLGVKWNRLGAYFEHLIAFWMQHSPHYELMEHRKAFHGPDRTIGEADFLIQNLAKERTEHWEVAVKFYLCADGQQAWSSWVGPNPDDLLEYKMHHLNETQLQLFDQHIPKAWLKDKKYTQPQPFAFVKGYFFNHFEGQETILPQHTAQPSQGDWLHYRELDRLEFLHTHYLALPKGYWMGKARIKDGELPLADEKNYLEEMKKAAYFGRRPLFIAGMSFQDGYYQEDARYVIVPDGWPN